MNSKDKRTALKPDTVIDLDLPNGGIESFCILEEIARGGSCIAYRALKGIDSTGYTGKTTHILKEFYPLGVKISRNQKNSLEYDGTSVNKIIKRKESFVQSVSVFAGKYEADSLHTLPRPYCGTANNTVYMISDIHTGCALSEQTSLRSMKDITEVMISLCAAIENIHSNNELFLDLKPSNVFLYELDGSFHVKLFDFDTVINKENLKNSISLSFSPGWGAPELENGIVKQISEKTDIFALGSILFWLITRGERVITNGPKNTMKLISSDRFPWNSYPLFFQCYGVNLKNRIKNILKNTLTVSPSSRYESVSLLREKLEEIQKIMTGNTIDLGDGRYYRKDLGEDNSEYIGNFFKDKKEGHGTYIFPNGTEIEGEWHNDEIVDEIRYTNTDGISYKGGWKNNTFEGTGSMIWPDGTQYTGMWAEGAENGSGKMIWPDGTWYEGDWVHGKRSGNGEMHYISGMRYRGQWLNDHYNGEGEMFWDTGHSYKGHFISDLRNGFGQMIYPNGNTYKGNWSDDMKEGYGSYTFAESGAVYSGDFHDNIRSGYGEITFPDGEYYAGHWDNDKRNGFGLVRYPKDRICSATWKDGMRNGQGTMSWPDGAYYTGEWQNDMPHGKGTQFYSDDRLYTGLWKENKRDGYGKMTWPDGASYEGEWSDGRYEGSGKMIWETGESYTGEWHEGKMHGHGVMRTKDGWTYDAVWNNNKLHGKGRRISPDFRRTDECTWEDGKLLEWHSAEL